mmetsp:Transcript_12781/g.21294  ORF Transcript_12781/g.21294 Transcript_12781/m.21294 type:complete len:81 (+) Transcript_12781:2527-2769(+)
MVWCLHDASGGGCVATCVCPHFKQCALSLGVPFVEGAVVVHSHVTRELETTENTLPERNSDPETRKMDGCESYGQSCSCI